MCSNMEDLKIHVKFSTGQISTFVVKSSDLIKDLKELINKQGMCPENFRRHLLFDFIQLEDNRKISDYNIQNGSVLELRLISGQRIQIKIKTSTGMSIVLNANSSDTIQEIKAKICCEETPDNKILFFAGKKLQDDRALYDYNIQDKSEIDLDLRERKITEKTLNPTMINISEALKYVREITEQERSETESFLSIMANRTEAQVTKNEILLYLLIKAMRNSGIDMFLTKKKVAEDATLRFHTQMSLSGIFVDVKYYESTFKDCRYESYQIKNSNELEEKFIQEFKNFLKVHGLIDPKNIYMVDILPGNKCRFITYEQLDLDSLNCNLTDGPLNSKHVVTKQLQHSVLISEDIFDHRFNMTYTTTHRLLNKKRGKERYYFPSGWTRIGLNIKDCFQYCENDSLNWLTMTNHDEEWSVAYHGTGAHCIDSILNNRLTVGCRQERKNYFNHNIRSNTFGEKCGIGVYCTPRVNIAEKYSIQASNEIMFDKKEYLVALQCRIDPKKFRDAGDFNYILNSEDIRPYGLLIKPKNNSCNLL